MIIQRSLQSLIVAGSLFTSVAFAGPAIVGVATAIGSFSVNDTSVAGTSNLTDGALLKTDATLSQVMLKNGSHVLMGTNSAANVYANKLVLQQGVARIDNMKPGFSVDAASVRVENELAGGQGAVRLNGGKIEVASVAGNMNVYNHQGALLARVPAGSVVSVDDPQSGASSDDDNNPDNNKKKKAGVYVPSGAGGGGTIMSNTGAIWIAAALAGVGTAVAIAVTHNSNNSSSPQ